MAIRTEHEFTVLYREHYDDVLRFVRRRAHEAAVDDVVADTFLTAWRRRADLPRDARPWLFVTARQLLLNEGRGRNRQEALAVKIGTIGERHDDTDVEARLDLVAAWRSLAPDEQEVLSLTVWENLSQADAATVVGCTRAAFSMRLTRARRRLAELLAVADPSTTLAFAAL
jgi:RNA polymerase sigma factor (sigma-70 family)